MPPGNPDGRSQLPCRGKGGFERRGKSDQERPHYHRDGAHKKQGSRK